MPDILKALFGVDVGKPGGTVVSVLVLLLIIYGVDIVRKKVFPGRRGRRPSH